MSRYLVYLIALLCMLVPQWSAAAPLAPEEELSIAHTYGCGVADDTCTVAQCQGGKLDDFSQAARILYTKHIQVVIDGPIYSACVVGADQLLGIARAVHMRGGVSVQDVICVTDRAQFGFHEGYIDHHDVRIFVPLEFKNDDIRAWVAANAPMPRSTELRDAKMMDTGAIIRIWPHCSNQNAHRINQ